MIAPVAIKLQAKALDHVGMTAGNLYALSTVGSLVGALASGFFLIPYFPVSIILQGTSITLALFALAWLTFIKMAQTREASDK